jgi:aminobenzoyl-glutamate transport protein
MMSESETPKPGRMERALAAVERVGSRLPDPAVLFIALLFIVWILSSTRSITISLRRYRPS